MYVKASDAIWALVEPILEEVPVLKGDCNGLLTYVMDEFAQRCRSEHIRFDIALIRISEAIANFFLERGGYPSLEIIIPEEFYKSGITHKADPESWERFLSRDSDRTQAVLRHSIAEQSKRFRGYSRACTESERTAVRSILENKKFSATRAMTKWFGKEYTKRLKLSEFETRIHSSIRSWEASLRKNGEEAN